MKLSELYALLDNLNSQNVDISELKTLIYQKEREILFSTIAPELKEICDILLQEIRQNVSISVEYSVENKTRINVSVDGKWYDFKGFCIKEDSYDLDANVSSSTKFVPKGQLSNVFKVAESSYEYLWMLAIVDLMNKEDKHSISYKDLACAMIANAWVILAKNPSLRQYECSIVECIRFFIDHSQKLNKELNWETSKETIYKVLKDYSKSKLTVKDYDKGSLFENTVEKLLKFAPINILKLWIHDDSNLSILIDSKLFHNSCLYALYYELENSYIVINSKWRNYLYVENENLQHYYTEQYVSCLKNFQSKKLPIVSSYKKGKM